MCNLGGLRTIPSTQPRPSMKPETEAISLPSRPNARIVSSGSAKTRRPGMVSIPATYASPLDASRSRRRGQGATETEGAADP